MWVHVYFLITDLHPGQLERDRTRAVVPFDLYRWHVPTGEAGSALLLAACGGMKW